MASDDLPSRAKKIVYRIDPIPFFTVIYNLSSSNESARSEAEKIYDVLRREYPIALCTKLFKLFESPQATIWPNLSIMFRNKLKETLLHSLENGKDLNVFYNLRATISDLAEDILPQNQWPGLNLFISFSLSSASSRAHFVVFSLFVELAPKIGEILSIHEDEVHNACVKDMTSESEDLTVRVAAVRASASLILYLSTESNWEKFEKLSVHLANTLSKAINKKLDLARKVVDCMIVLAEEKTGILRNHIDLLAGSMIMIAEQEGLQDETRNLAIEFVLTVAEDRKEGCGMIEKMDNDLNSLLGILMEMLMSVEDDKSWYDAGSDNLNAVASSEFFHGKQSFRRLALALGGNAIFRNYREMLSEFLVDKDWRKRHAAVTALGSIIEGCSKVSDEHLGNLIEIVLSFFQDSHPRVCWAAINAAGQFCKDLDPQLQNQLHQHLVPALTVAMDDSKNPRVQAQAVSAMQLFSCNCTPDILKPYLKGIVSKLLDFLQKGKRMLKEGALTTLASIASLMKNDFEQYYETVMPDLILMLLSETEKHNGMLVAKSVDCITMVGLAVGKEKFSGDAQQVVEVLTSLQESQLETDDPIRRHLLQAWGRLCKCLGQDFLPYMSVAMPQLLDSARLNICLSDHNGTVQSDVGSMEEQTSTSGRFWIKPWVLEEKVLACNMLCCCVAELKGRLHLWIYEVAETLVPLLKFKFDGEVRSAAVTAMPLLLRSTISALEERFHLPGFNESPIKELSCRIIPALVESLNKEYKTEIRGKFLDSLTECIQVASSWLSHLSMINDLQEAKVVHAQLCSMVEELEEDFDPKNENLSKIITVFTEVMWAGNNLGTEETVSRMIKQLKQIQQKLTPAKLESLCSTIPLQRKKMLNSIFSS